MCHRVLLIPVLVGGISVFYINMRSPYHIVQQTRFPRRLSLERRISNIEISAAPITWTTSIDDRPGRQMGRVEGRIQRDERTQDEPAKKKTGDDAVPRRTCIGTPVCPPTSIFLRHGSLGDGLFYFWYQGRYQDMYLDEVLRTHWCC